MSKMLIHRSYKTELNPNNAQRTIFAKHAGVARHAYNWGVAEVKKAMEAKEKIPSGFDLSKRLNAIKDEHFTWMRECSKNAPQYALRHVDLSFRNFFSNCRKKKTGQKIKAGFPRFKKKGERDSFRFQCEPGFLVTEGRILLPKIGWVRLKEHRYLPTGGVKFLSATVSRRADRWYVSLAVQQEIPDTVNKPISVVGVDLGVKTLAVCSDGTVFESPRPLKKHLRRLKRLNRSLSRKKKGSKNRFKAKLKLSRLHLRVSNIRKDSLHKITTQLTKTKSRVVIEDLNVRGMVQNRKLSRAISDMGFWEFRRQLEYKGKWHGCEIVVAPRFFPSSKTCSKCGNVKDEMSMKDRTYVCECGLELDRDLNAAINLSRVVDRQSETLNACGGTSPLAGTQVPVKRSLRSRKQASRQGKKS